MHPASTRWIKFTGRLIDSSAEGAEEFFDILRKEVEVIRGYCYTQLTDVEQEQNGVCYYDRTPKFDPAKFKALFGQDR